MSNDVTWVRNVRFADGTTSDVELRNGVFGAFGAAPDGVEAIDGKGRLILPPLVEGHCHLDKTLLGCPWMGFVGGKNVKARIVEEKTLRRGLAMPVEERGALLLEAEIAAGTGYLRSHVDIDAEWKLANLEAVVALRERYRDRIDIQIVAFPQSGILASPGTEHLLDEAMRSGADIMGGLDPAYIDDDPVRHLDIVFGLADRYRAPVDIHLHEGGALGLFELGLIADRTEALSMQGQVTVSHAYCLADASAGDLVAIAERLARAQISILSSAPEERMPPVRALRAAGVNVFLGSDNVRDAWSPFGNGDMLDRAGIAARQQAFVGDEELSTVFDMVTQASARALQIEGYGIAPGNAASFVLVEAENLAQAIASRAMKRVTYRNGVKVGEAE
ncbi:MAG: amidohydrolase family protein [Mesorhizobium sp.]